MPSITLKFPIVLTDWPDLSSIKLPPNLPVEVSDRIEDIVPNLGATLESLFQNPMQLPFPNPPGDLVPDAIEDFLADTIGDILPELLKGDWENWVSPHLLGQVNQLVETAYQYVEVNYPALITQVQQQVQQITRNLPNLNFTNPLTIRPSWVPLTQRFNEVIVVGDSLSDQGNLFKARGPLFLPQGAVNGRFSNGDIWVDYLLPQLGITDNQKIQNFAFGGATSGRVNIANNVPVPFPLLPLPGLLDQIDTAKATLSAATQTNPKALYVVWAGANDFLTLPKDTTAAVQAVIASVDNIQKSVEQLAGLGAKTIAVANLPNLGLTPLAAANGVKPQATVFSTVFNTLLQGTLGALESRLGVDVVLVDVFSLVQSIAARPSEFGLTNITSPLFSQNPPPANPDTFAFADDFHPTTAVHRLVADTFKRSLASPRLSQALPNTLEAVEQLVNSSGLRSQLNQLLGDWLPGNAPGNAKVALSVSSSGVGAAAAAAVFAGI